MSKALFKQSSESIWINLFLTASTSAHINSPVHGFHVLFETSSMKAISETQYSGKYWSYFTRNIPISPLKALG